VIIGISGRAGSGKDTAADFLVDHGFVKVALADEMKRTCRRVFGFSIEQLWGPSEKRNEPDKRYPRQHGPFVGFTLDTCACCGVQPYLEVDSKSYSECYLTPRFALQQLGSEWGRACYPNVWVEYVLGVASKVEEGGYVTYLADCGLVEGGPAAKYSGLKPIPPRHVVIPDVRFLNEFDKLRKAGGKLIRIVRPGAGLSGAAGAHGSETEQNNIPDSEFDAVIQNDGALDWLRTQINGWFFSEVKGK
jgi:hypothetical protein